MNIRWRIELFQDEREELTALLKTCRHAVRASARTIQILLAADDVRSVKAIAARNRRLHPNAFVEGNLELALAEAPRPGAQRKLGKEEALPDRHRLLGPAGGPRALDADTMVGSPSMRGHRDRASPAENALKPLRSNADVAAIEDVLDLYCEPPDATQSSASTTSPTQLIGEVRWPSPAGWSASTRVQGHRTTCRRRLSQSSTSPTEKIRVGTTSRPTARPPSTT